MCGVCVFQSFIDKYMKNPTGIKLCILHNLWCLCPQYLPDLLFQIIHARPVVSDHSYQTCCFRSFIPVEPSCWRASCPTVVTSQYWKTVDTLSTLTDPWPLATPSFVSVVMHLLAGSDWRDIDSWWIKMLWFYPFAFSVKQVPDFVAFIKCLQEQMWCDFIMCLKNSS